jgi:hypothetical protein
MSSGFNTDIRVGDHVFHVQTEDRGHHHPVIDTVVYQNGRVLHRRASDYADFAASSSFSADELHARVREQHRSVIEALRAGSLDTEIAAITEQASQASGIHVKLLNRGSWLSGGKVFLDIEISRRADHHPVPGVQVEATIEGALRETRLCATSDDHGRARIRFPLPPLGKGDLALVVRAKSGAANDEIRFAMRTRAKNPPASPPQ